MLRNGKTEQVLVEFELQSLQIDAMSSIIWRRCFHMSLKLANIGRKVSGCRPRSGRLHLNFWVLLLTSSAKFVVFRWVAVVFGAGKVSLRAVCAYQPVFPENGASCVVFFL